MHSFFSSSTIDFLAIGDVTTDVFIHLTEARVQSDKDNHFELCIKYPDKVPFESATEVAGVGNSPNAAVSAARLGLRSAILCSIGDDAHGKTSIDSLKHNKVDTRFVSIQHDKPSNYHYVLWYEADRTILVKHQLFEYALPKIPSPPRWIYLSSLGDNSYEYHKQIAAYLAANPSIKLAFQPGTYQMRLGLEKMKEFYARSEVFICNLEESQFILGDTTKDVSVLLKKIKDLGPRIVLITDGSNGAYMMYDNDKTYFMPIYPDVKPPYERTGCGDAFASTFVSALALGKVPLEALSWAPINSMSVVEYVGAQAGLLSRAKLEEFLKQAPPEYRPTLYNNFLKSQS